MSFNIVSLTHEGQQLVLIKTLILLYEVHLKSMKSYNFLFCKSNLLTSFSQKFNKE